MDFLSENKVSVIIPVYNCSQYILETLGSLCENGISENRITIVDDGSDDGSGQIIKDNFPLIKLIRTENQGVSAARNLGIKETNSKYIVFLDADDLIVGDKIARQIKIADETNADVIYGNWQKLIKSETKNWVLGQKIERKLNKNPVLDLFTSFWCPTGAYLFKRSIVEKVGGYRPDLPIIQDARFVLDCAMAGAKFVHDPAIACLYRVHYSGSVSTTSRENFALDCLKNAIQINEVFKNNGCQQYQDHKIAIAKVANFCANNLVDTPFKKEFAEACGLFKKTGRIGYTVLSQGTRVMAYLFGYKGALIIKKIMVNFARKIKSKGS